MKCLNLKIDNGFGYCAFKTNSEKDVNAIKEIKNSFVKIWEELEEDKEGKVTPYMNGKHCPFYNYLKTNCQQCPKYISE